jgi:hypothetical protein
MMLTVDHAKVLEDLANAQTQSQIDQILHNAEQRLKRAGSSSAEIRDFWQLLGEGFADMDISAGGSSRSQTRHGQLRAFVRAQIQARESKAARQSMVRA